MIARADVPIYDGGYAASQTRQAKQLSTVSRLVLDQVRNQARTAATAAWVSYEGAKTAVAADLMSLVLLTPQEWARWPELHMRLSVNGQTRQDAYCAEMIHGPAATLTELAALQALNPGDLLATGTPAGCAARAPGKLTMFILRHLVSESGKWQMFIRKGRSNPAYLRPGDQISASIRTDDGAIDLGEQTTSIVAP